MNIFSRSLYLVEMMGFGRSANYALWPPSALTVINCHSLPPLFESVKIKLQSSVFHLSLGGDDGIRTHDPLLAGQVLSQLSYTPVVTVVVSSPSVLFSFRK